MLTIINLTIKCAIAFFLCILFVGDSYCVISKLTLYKDEDFSGDGLIITKQIDNFNCTIFDASGQCMTGMWQIFYAGTSNVKIAPYAAKTEECSALLDLSPVAMRPLASINTSVQSISLYEDKLTAIPWAVEHYFDQSAWTGLSSFPVGAMALTGWSNWTLYEDAFFEGRSWCVRSNDEFQYSDNLNISTLLTRVGSLYRGCDLKADYVLNVGE